MPKSPRTGIVFAAIAALLFAAAPPATAEPPPQPTQQAQRNEPSHISRNLDEPAGTPRAAWIRVASLYGSANQCLEATGGHDGAHARVWPCDGSSEQDWWRGNDSTLRNSRYPTKCLDADATSGGVNGAWVQTWECNGSSQQRWPTRPDDMALYNERFLNNYNTVLDRDVTWSGNGAPVQLWQKNFQPQQWWTFF